MYRRTDHTYAEIIAELEQAIAWLESMCIATSTKRHAKYLRTIRLINREWLARGVMRADDVPVEAKRMTTSFAEAFQLIKIWNAFAGNEPSGLAAKLKLFAKGPELEREERPTKSGNSARDAGFELEIAAFFVPAGPVELTRGVDIVVRFQGIPLFIECKRPSSTGMFAENLDRAAGQLQAELDKTRLASYGIAAVSVAKAGWAGGVVLGASRVEQVLGSLNAWTARIDQEYLAAWFERQRDPRMLAVLVHIPYEADLEDAPPRPSVQSNLIIRRNPGAHARNDLDRLKIMLGA